MPGTLISQQYVFIAWCLWPTRFNFIALKRTPLMSFHWHADMFWEFWFSHLCRVTFYNQHTEFQCRLYYHAVTVMLHKSCCKRYTYRVSVESFSFPLINFITTLTVAPCHMNYPAVLHNIIPLGSVTIKMYIVSRLCPKNKKRVYFSVLNAKSLCV
jgi:hypothetical protein